MSEWISRISFFSCLVGGVTLCAVVLITVGNVIGRSLIFMGLSPIPGDFELVEFLIAFSIFHFLPWCQLQNKHIAVDVLVNFFPNKFKTVSHILSQCLMLLVTVIIAWRLWHGMLELRKYNEISFILHIPLWWNYLSVLPVTILASVVACYSLCCSTRNDLDV